MADSSTDQSNSVTYISGVDATGAVGAATFNNWNGDTPPTYTSTQGFVHKWSNDSSGVQIGDYSTAGTASGTITYSFGSGVTAAQQQSFISDLTLWSDEANVSFVQDTASPGTADLVLNVSTNDTIGTSNTSAPQVYSVAGSSSIPTETTPTRPQGSADTIDFDNSGAYGTLGSFTAYGGYGVSALTHEIGHSLGLGHSGPYDDGNAGTNPDKQQYNEFDSRQWSVMSYIDPSDTAATYYNSYTVKGTNWTISQTSGSTTTNYQGAPETPMIDDITAAQRLYGAPTTTALSGGQIFGFNCNVSDASKPFFDFTQNTSPIITLYDTGTNNRLDLSGFSADSVINLNPGTFSSAGGLTNNIGIAVGTKIDTAIGGAGANQYIVNADADTFNGYRSTNNTVVFSKASSNYTIVRQSADTVLVTDTTTGIEDTLTDIQTAQFADQSIAVCYCSGTRIRTARGDVAVEDLVVGDIAVTASGARRAIAWLGHRTLNCQALRDRDVILPIRIAAHAFGPERPARDLFVSPGHAICVEIMDEVLIPAVSLVNGATVAHVEFDTVTYWHVALEGGHDILLAENLPAESYIDIGNRDFFIENGTVALAPRPDDAARTLADYCRPYLGDGPMVQAARNRMRARALTLGWTLDQTLFAGMHLVADGIVVEPTVDGLSARFILPADARDVWLVSDASVPADVSDSADTRQLGVNLRGISIDDGFTRRVIAVDDALLCVGFQAPDGDGSWRWTAGRARLPAALWAGCVDVFFLRIDLAGPALPHWRAPDVSEAFRKVGS